MENTTNNEGISLSALSEGAIPTATPSVSMMPNRLPKLDPTKVIEADPNVVVLPAGKDVPQLELGSPLIDDALKNLDGAIERTRQESLEILNKAKEQRIEDNFDNDDTINTVPQNIKLIDPSSKGVSTTIDDVSFEDEEDIPEFEFKKEDVKPMNTVVEQAPVKEAIVNTEIEKPKSIYKPESINANVSEDDMKLLDDEDDIIDSDEDKEAATEEIKEKIREEMKTNFNPVSEKIDFSKFKVSKKPVSASKVINHIQERPIEAADGVLFAANRAVRMSALSAVEIQSLDQSNIRRGNYNQHMINRLHLIYDHLIDANKPASFEAWMKLATNDLVDDYFFTAYKATFGLSNILTYSCQDNDCHNVFMKKRNIEDMIKFKNDDVKAKYMEILHSGNVNTISNMYESELFQASDEYVLSLRKPSLYNTYIEPSLINEEFMKKYEDLMLLISYIDDIYIIDKANSELIKIDTKPDARRPDVTVKRKIKTYGTVIKSLTSDQLQALSVATDKFDSGELDDKGNLITDIKYIIPEEVCEKCGKVIPEQEDTPDNMLFMRHQLGAMSKI